MNWRFPSSPITRNVPDNGGAATPSKSNVQKDAHGTQGNQSVFDSVLRYSSDQHGADADTHGQQGERKARHRIREMQDGFGIDEHVLAEQARDRPEKDFHGNGHAQHPFGLNRRPCASDR